MNKTTRVDFDEDQAFTFQEATELLRFNLHGFVFENARGAAFYVDKSGQLIAESREA